MASRPLPPLPPGDLEHTLRLVGSSWQILHDRRIFITGGTGFIGKWLLESLLYAHRTLDLRCEVVVLSRNPAAFAKQAPHLARAENLKLVQGDIRSFNLDAGADVVIHAAADVVDQQSPLEVFDACVNGTRRVLNLAVANRCSHFLLISSGAVYGRQHPTVHRLAESHTGGPDVALPNAAYGEGKRASELLSAIYASEHGLDVKIARCFAFVGPYLALDKQFAIGNFIRDALVNGSITINGDGSAMRTYLYAADMAAWLWTILLRGRSGQAYNVGGDEIVSIHQLARRVVDVLDSRSGIVIRQQPRPGVAPERYVPDITKSASELNLRVSVALDAAIERTAAFHRMVN